MPEKDQEERPESLQPGSAAAALLHDLSSWRDQLARSIARNNLGLRSGHIATAVNRMIFSLLLLRFAEDRGLIPAGTIRKTAVASPPAILAALLRYSGNLYLHDPPLDSEGGDFTGLSVDDRILTAILDALDSPDHRSDPSAFRIENLSAVLQRYLSRTVRRSAAHQAIIVDEHDTTHSGGTTVPPLTAVAYLVKTSVAAIREARSRREPLPIRILDPACGAGCILLAVYQDLLEGYHGGNPHTEERREILTDSVYGLDISPHAVAATRLLLLFRLAETMDPATADDFLSYADGVFHDLRHNIRCGNALIGPDIARDEAWMFCPPRDRHALRPFSWEQGYPEIFASGGFDAVISNPPEGPVPDREWIRRYFQRHYAVYHPLVDRSAYFLERALPLARAGGSVSFLMTGRWLRGSAGTHLREYVSGWQIGEIVEFSGTSDDGPAGASSSLRICTMPPARPFRATVTGPGFFTDPDKYVSAHGFFVDQTRLDAGGWQFRDTRSEGIVRRAFQHAAALEDVVMGQVHSGMPIREGEPFTVREDLAREWLKRDPGCRPLLYRVAKGAGIGRYGVRESGLWYLLIPAGWTGRKSRGEQPWRWLRRRHPLIARYLQPFSEILKARAGPGRLWWENGDIAFWQEPGKKVLFPARFSEPGFLCDSGRLIGDGTTVAIPSAGYYLPGILNSRLMAFVFRHAVRQAAPDREWFAWEDLRNLPVYTPDFDRPEDRSRHERMERLVLRRIALEKSCRAAAPDHREPVRKKIRSAERQIDALVYELYGLTKDEIAVIEGKSG